MSVYTRSIETKATARLGFVDLTEELAEAIRLSGAKDGIAVVFCRHTTSVLVVNEWEQGAHEDAARCLATVAPATMYYAHDDMTRRTQNIQGENEPANGQAHVLATLLGGTNQIFPFRDYRADLGRWQRLLLLELDDPKPREVVFTVLT